jgi:hypothetical protein
MRIVEKGVVRKGGMCVCVCVCEVSDKDEEKGSFMSQLGAKESQNCPSKSSFEWKCKRSNNVHCSIRIPFPLSIGICNKDFWLDSSQANAIQRRVNLWMKKRHANL